MLAVIVINYHSDEQTVKFIREECAKIQSAHCIIVVNNEADEHSSKNMETALHHTCHIIENKENVGFARGNNAGAEYARDHFGADKLLFVNNDIRFCDEVADRLSQRLDELPDVGVIGPKVMGTDGRLQSPEPFMSFWDRHVWVYWSNLFWSRRHRRKYFRQDYAETAAEGCCYRVSGACMMVRASDFFACGEMDPQTFLYAEEPILSERMKSIGKKVWYCPEVSVLHEHGGTTRKYYDKVRIRQMKFESDCYYYRTYIGTPGWQISIAKLTYFLKKVFNR